MDESLSPNGQPSLKDRVKELQLSSHLDGPKSPRGGSSTSWLPWLLCIMMALAWAGVGIRYYRTTGTKEADGPSTTEAKSTGSSPAGGSAKKAGEGEVVLVSKGYLIPSHSIPVSPIDVAGRIIRLEIEEGKMFEKGQVLAAIDPSRFVAEYKEAEAQHLAASARFEELQGSWVYEKQQSEAELAEARAQLAKDELEYQTAQATLSGAVAKLELGTLKKKLDATKERVRVMEIKNNLMKGRPREYRIEAALRDREAAEARLARCKWQLDNCTIVAPVTGVILRKNAEYGSLINPVVGGVSTSLCDIADLRMLEVDLEIQERDIAKITEGMTCRIRSDAYPDRVYDGWFDRAMPIANRARGIIPVRVRVVVPPDEKQGAYLKPEMGVEVTFINTPFPESRKNLFEFWTRVMELARAATFSTPKER